MLLVLPLLGVDVAAGPFAGIAVPADVALYLVRCVHPRLAGRALQTDAPRLPRVSEPAPSRRIAADLRHAIRDGEYRPGHQLPSGSVLMARYGVARQTVQNAIDLLRAEGLVIGRSGAGWFVRERPAVQRLARNRLSRDERVAGRGTATDAADVAGNPASRSRSAANPPTSALPPSYASLLGTKSWCASAS